MTEASFTDTLNFQDATHCAHVMIWASLKDRLILDKYPGRAAVLMQMRFDGCLGFPGGIVDDRIEDMDPDVAMGFVTAGLNRELVEEVNADLSIVKVTGRDYVYTLSDKVPYVTQLVVEPTLCHFFTKEVELSQFEDLERAALSAKDFGDEVMGHIRVPLYTMDDGKRGYPEFLKNNFIGQAKAQLIRGLSHINIW
ncbi:U8 snoRNA-decapping enzyme isoform X2 [Folsomia candida]|uniref:U8 snoRNA-decapping enzyme isoform X2 n=1 Tax=Folsomia candida TaxID=158441 RepID=UPI000B8EE9B7|nr:U8 snoRNA-decapping enzyme isoform X2 [Folsomia candida]